MLWAKIATLSIGILAIIFAIKIKSLIDICICAWSFWSPIILIPLIAIFLGVKADKKVFYISAASGILTVIIWNNMFGTPWGIDGLVLGVIANAITFTISNKIVKVNSTVAN